jgi:hypothetical protein
MGMLAKALLLIMPPQVGLLSGFCAGLVSIANFIGPRQPNLEIKILDYMSLR